MRSCGSRKLRLSAFQRECPDSLLYLRLIFIRRTLTAAALCHIAGDRTREQSSSCVPCEFRSSVSPVRSQRSCILLRSKALGPGPGWHRPSSLLCRTVPPFPAPPTAAKIVRAPCARALPFCPFCTIAPQPSGSLCNGMHPAPILSPFLQPTVTLQTPLEFGSVLRPKIYYAVTMPFICFYFALPPEASVQILTFFLHQSVL